MHHPLSTSRLRGGLIALLAAVVVAPLTLTVTWANAAEEQGEHPPIHHYMETINENYKLLRRAARRPSYLEREQYLGMVIEMQEASLKALHVETIPMAEKLSNEEEKQQMMLGYRQIQAELTKALIDLELTMREGKYEEAAELINGLAEIKQRGHDKFVDEAAA